MIRNVLEERKNVTFVEENQSTKKQDGGTHELSSPNNATQLKILTNTSTLSTDESITDVQGGFILKDTSVLCDFISRIAKKCHIQLRKGTF